MCGEKGLEGLVEREVVEGKVIEGRLSICCRQASTLEDQGYARVVEPGDNLVVYLGKVR